LKEKKPIDKISIHYMPIAPMYEQVTNRSVHVHVDVIPA